MKSLFVWSCLFSLLLLTGCNVEKLISGGTGVKGSGVEKTEKREVGKFTGVEMNCYAKVNITCQNTDKVEITGDDNILPLLVTEVKDNTLYLSTSQNYISKNKLQINIAVPNVEKVGLSGAGELNITNLKNAKMSMEVSGAGTVKASGETEQLDIALSGAGSLDARDLHAKKAVAVTSGAGSVSLFASDELEAKVSGVGSIDYYGNPKTVNKKVSGVGSINAK